MSINNVGMSGIQSTLALAKGGVAKPADIVGQVGSTFSEILQNLETSQKTSDNLMTRLAAGEDVDLGQLMIATNKTDIDFRVAMGIRDRLVSAYQEIMRMTV
jgi:flagellar hook-basal body complex protein FliE